MAAFRAKWSGSKCRDCRCTIRQGQRIKPATCGSGFVHANCPGTTTTKGPMTIRYTRPGNPVSDPVLGAEERAVQYPSTW